MSSDAGGAPPLGMRPNEPRPGKDSLADPQGKGNEGSDGKGNEGSDGNGKGEACPDCGLPFGQHPEYHMHGGGSATWAKVDLGDADMDADPLPGKRLDQELGGDPAE